MSQSIRVLGFAGSLRRDSWNKKLAHVAAEAARAAGAEVTELDLCDYEMPLYDGDLEQESGLPPKAKAFREMLKSHQALLISSPEYNSSIPGVLKNAIDWASRNEKGQGSPDAFDGKVAGLLAASPGALGGLRGLVTLRSILGNLRVLVVNEQIALGKAHEAFDEKGALRDEKQAETVRKIANRVVHVARALANG
jgi:NAD(P)H-dependent FMN reductase